MSQHAAIRRFRPDLFTSFRRFRCQPNARRASSHVTPLQKAAQPDKETTNDYERRVAQLEAITPTGERYPRLQHAANARMSTKEFRRKYESLKPGETCEDNTVILSGRFQSVRAAGSKLVFADLRQGDATVQAIVQLNKIKNDHKEEHMLQRFQDFTKIARRGDWYSIQGQPDRSPRGELSILAGAVPTLLSPSLHQIPETLEDAETRTRNRHVDMLVNRSAGQTLRVRHAVEQNINDFFDAEGFTAVKTPILSAGAGGAVARPFETEATELEGQNLDLRIAPELWLKRLIVGGLDKVYEIGPCFRNEGVDATHNPEFYTCEFYEAFATLEDLMTKTEKLLCGMAEYIGIIWTWEPQKMNALPRPPMFEGPFARLEFLPALQRELGCTLPDLSDPSAQGQILSIFKDKSIPPPSQPTLPRLLDALASHYLEPLCTTPTFITHHPACLSPLSKHFLCPTTNQTVSARAELFIQNREIANMYEEENSPFEQRRKFLEQAKYRQDGDEEGMKIDESYLEVLEWGLPPTGGWGCGVERLVMLFSGRERMSDVLAFGSLRNVVGLGKGKKRS